MFDNKLPVHPLYYKGYRSIDGKYDSTKTSEKPAWEQDSDNYTLLTKSLKILS